MIQVHKKRRHGAVQGTHEASMERLDVQRDPNTNTLVIGLRCFSYCSATLLVGATMIAFATMLSLSMVVVSLRLGILGESTFDFVLFSPPVPKHAHGHLESKPNGLSDSGVAQGEHLVGSSHTLHGPVEDMRKAGAVALGSLVGASGSEQGGVPSQPPAWHDSATRSARRRITEPIVGNGRWRARTKRQFDSWRAASSRQATQSIGPASRNFPPFVDVSHEFLNKSGRGGQCLKFLHIPKSAGTSIEHIHRPDPNDTSGINGWGKFDRDLHCRQYGKAGESQSKCRFTDERRQKGTCSMWHVPPYLEPPLAHAYGECDTFCIVRHPVTRMLSQHLFENGLCTVESFERHVNNVLNVLPNNPYLGDCHYVSQSVYVFGRNAGKSSNRKYCQHILRFENLTSDFANVMRKFALNLTVNVHKAPRDSKDRRRRTVPGCDFPYEMLSARVHRKIQEHYAVDYKTFGYKMLLTMVGNASQEFPTVVSDTDRKQKHRRKKRVPLNKRRRFPAVISNSSGIESYRKRKKVTRIFYLVSSLVITFFVVLCAMLLHRVWSLVGEIGEGGQDLDM